MALKRFPQNDYTVKNCSFTAEQAGVPNLTPELTPHSSLKFTAPKPIPPRKGKRLVAFAVLSAIGYAGYSVWDTYFRYEAHGIITANMVGVYAPFDGNIVRLDVVEGQYIQKNQIVGHITNPEHYHELEKIMDEIRMTEGDIVSRESEIRWRRGNNAETYFKAKGEMETTEGSLNELRANLIMEEATLRRIRILQKEGAVSRNELDKALADVAATKSLIASREKTLRSMQARLKSSENLINDTGEEQIIPLKEKLVFLNNEKTRLEQKIETGQFMAPVSGIVSKIDFFAGESIKEQSIFTIVEDDTSNLVLYYEPNSRLPNIGDSVTVFSPSKNKMIETIVTGISRDTVEAPVQIQKSYAANSKLIRVFLNAQEVNVNDFVVGSTIKRPSFLEQAVNITTISNMFFSNNAFAKK